MEVTPGANQPLNHIKSKQHVADHGEVFTPAWLVEAMLDGNIPTYEEFLEERRKLMALKIKTWFEAL